MFPVSEADVDLRALIPFLAGALLAAEIDPNAVAEPYRVQLADRALDTRWRALFSADPAWASRQIAFLARRTGDQFPTLVAARLLYRGEAWTRRGTEQVNARRWRAADQEVRLALLREMRWRRDPALVPFLVALLAQERNGPVADATLVTLWLLDADAGLTAARRLADPKDPERLPATALPGVRERALDLLLDLRGVADPLCRPALSWALLSASGSERNHAIAALAPGEGGDLLHAALLRLAEEHREDRLDDDGQAGLAMACARLAGAIPSPLATALVGIAVKGTREIATPAASALAGNLSWTSTVPVDAIAARAARDQDPVVRHALRSLLLRIKPDLVSMGETDDPWAALGAHRERLSRWEWEQYTR